MLLDPDHAYRILTSRDPRFDGTLVAAVRTTRIYCRPSCPARTPKPENVTFFRTAAAAQAAGYRACKRCRPDASPGSPEWNVRADVVARAMRLIADGVVDREGVAGLARRLAYSPRHLTRLLTAEVGAGPLAVARAQRAQVARLLIETTTMPFADVAFAAGFSSVRQFNDTVREVFATPPSALRARRQPSSGPGQLALRLPYRSPMDVRGVLDFLGLRAIAGIETYDGATYRRSLRLPYGSGVVALSPGPGHVACDLMLDDLRDLQAAVQRCRRLLDLDADPEAVDTHLAGDDVLASWVRKTPGTRVPGAVDGTELAVRAVLGQQVSVTGAATLASRLVLRSGEPLSQPRGDITHVFPTAESLAGTDPAGLGVPGARARALGALAGAIARGDLVLDPGADREAAVAALCAIPGIGAWTSSYVAMRALGDPDVFLATDLGVRRGAIRVGLPDSPQALTEQAQRWRPWRSYAVLRLWSANYPDKEAP